MILKEGEAIQKGYGLAYKNYCSLTIVVYPIPLNLLVRFFREIYFWLMRGCWKSKWEEKLKEANQQGFERGLNLTLKLQVPPEIKIKYLKRGLEVIRKGWNKTEEEIEKLWKEAIED